MKAIVAMTPSRVIGWQNQLPWRLPDDLRWFKRTTLGHPVLMGRKTFESIGKPLAGRRNLVVSRTANFPGVDMIHDLHDFQPNRYRPEVCVIGGAEIYRQLLSRLDEIIVTRLKCEYHGDAFFPPFEDNFVLTATLEETPEFIRVRYRRQSGSSTR